MKVRGSKADLAMHCAGSLVETDAPYNPNSDEARDGTAKHEALAYLARGEDPPIEKIAARHQVEVDDLAVAVACGRKAWAQLRQWLPNAKTEVRLEGFVTCGTADVLSVGDGTIAVLDWKTGWGRDYHLFQLMAYADATRHQHGMPASGYVSCFEVHTASGEYVTRNLSADELDGFRERITKQIGQAGKQFGPGSHCQWCHRQNACQARDEFLRGTIAALVPVNEQPVTFTREMLGRLFEPYKAVMKYAVAYAKVLDAALAEGTITLADGRVLGLKSVEKDEISALEAERILRAEGWGDAELAEVLGATKSGIDRVIKGRVAKGGAAAEMRRVLDLLRKAGAISKVTSMQKEIL